MTQPTNEPNLAGLARRLTLAEAPIPRLVEIWLAQLDSFANLAASLNERQWHEASPCPGWSCGDVVAHVLALESELHGEPLPDHEPDWDQLPHVTTPFGRYTEQAVDRWRTEPRDVVVAELREMIEWRRQDLAGVPDDGGEIVTGPAGWQTSRQRMIQTRVLDTWVHEQDLRVAAGLPGGLDTDAAWVTAARFVAGLPYVWGKSLKARVGSSLRVDVNGPGVEFDVVIRTGVDGRARVVNPRAVTEPTVTLRAPWPTFVALAAGRRGAVADAYSSGARIYGDHELGQRLLPALAVTP